MRTIVGLCLLLLCFPLYAQQTLPQTQPTHLISPDDRQDDIDLFTVPGCTRVLAGVWSFNADNCAFDTDPDRYSQLFAVDPTNFPSANDNCIIFLRHHKRRRCGPPVLFGGVPTLDADIHTLGDIEGRTIGGTADAFLFQSAAGADDGIANALSASNASVVAQAGYDDIEANEGGGGYRSPFFSGEQGNHIPWADNTCLFDYRSSYRGTLCHNPNPGAYPLFYHRFASDDIAQAPGGGEQWSGNVSEWLVQCCGKNEQNVLGVGNWTVHHHNDSSIFDLTRGITSETLNIVLKAGIGDTQVHSCDLSYNGGTIEGSAEGGTCDRRQLFQDQNPFSGTAISNLSAGTTVIPITRSGASNLPGEGVPLVDTTEASGTIHITATTGPSGNTPGTWTTLETITPDNPCTLTQDVATPQLYRDGTTAETFNVSCPKGAIATTRPICIADSINMESAQVTAAGALSGGVQQITANLKLAHTNGAIVMQGLSACHFAEITANQITNGGNAPLRNLVREIGHYDYHTIWYSAHLQGHWTGAPNGAFSTTVIPKGVVLTRDSSGNVTTSPFNGGYNWQWQGDTLDIPASSVPDSSFAGVFVSTQTQDGNVILKWSNPGPAASTTTTSSIYIQVHGVDSDAIVEMPGGDIYEAQNPTTKTVDGTVVIEYSDFGIKAGDILEAQPQPERVTNMEHDNVQEFTPTSDSQNGAVYSVGFGPIIPDGKVVYQFSPSVSNSDYLGTGGTRRRTAGIFAQNSGGDPWAFWMSAPPPENTGFLFTTHNWNCGMHPCNDPAASFGLYQFDGAYGIFESNFNEATGTYSESTSAGEGAPVRGTTNVSIAPYTWSLQQNDGISSSNVMQTGLGSFNLQIVDGAQSGQWQMLYNTGNNLTSNVTLAGAVSHYLQSAAGFSMDQPLTESVATGTAPFVVTSTTRVANLNVSQSGQADQFTTTPAQCPAGQFATGIAINGAANCAPSSGVGSGAAVTQIVAGNGIAITPATGTGVVTVSATGVGGSPGADLWWSATACTIRNLDEYEHEHEHVEAGMGCQGETALPGPMSDSNWFFECTPNLNQADLKPPTTFAWTANLISPFPTASGAKLAYGLTVTQIRGRVRSITPQLFCRAHHL